MAYDKTEIPKYVYHYTTIEGLLGILSSRTLYASNISFLNDRKELIYVDDFIRELIVSRFATVFNDLQKRGIMTDNVDIDMISEHEANNFLKSIHKTSREASPIFVISFCRAGSMFEEQNGLLSQWRGYGHDGGIALRFEVGGLEAMCRYESENYLLTSTFVGDVIYGSDDPEFGDIGNELAAFADAVPDIIENMLKNWGIRYEYPGDKISLDDMHRPYAFVAPRLKHPGFSEEKEYRLAVTVWTGDNVPNETRSRKPVKFRRRDNYLLPYVEIGCSEQQPFPLKQIIVGPSREMERRTDSIRSLAQQYDADIEVIQSTIPFA